MQTVKIDITNQYREIAEKALAEKTIMLRAQRDAETDELEQKIQDCMLEFMENADNPMRKKIEKVASVGAQSVNFNNLNQLGITALGRLGFTVIRDGTNSWTVTWEKKETDEQDVVSETKSVSLKHKKLGFFLAYAWVAPMTGILGRSHLSVWDILFTTIITDAILAIAIYKWPFVEMENPWK